MLEIFFIIWLWRTNSRNALNKGQKPTKYRVLTLVLWFGLEIMGTIAGAVGIMALYPGADPLIGSYLFGISGAALGGILSYQIAKNAPQGDYHPEDQNQYQYQQWNQSQDVWSKSPMDDRSWQDGAYHYGPEQRSQQIDMLSCPATIRIVEEEGGYQGGQDAFYLNGFPICSLRPGSEYTFTTANTRNMITIGRPNYPADEKEYIVRFIAAENGYVEIHARAGKLLPDLFKNFASA